MKIKRLLFFTVIAFVLSANSFIIADELPNSTGGKYPDYACMFLGEDKCENFNRKVFKFNTKLNKYLIKPADILWASIMPKYGMDRIRGVYKNIEYPKRLVSSLIQKDFKGSGRETLRFLTNSTIGLAGMFDPAKSFFKLEPVDENMEQALGKCKCNQGKYLVMPVINGCTPRSLCGKALDTALNPTCYIGTPILALIKLGFTLNETVYMQPLFDMVQSNYADSYDIAKKLYGIENHIKANNLDRSEVLSEFENSQYQNNGDIFTDNSTTPVTLAQKDIDEDKISYAELLKEGITKERYILKHSKPRADFVLEGYNKQTPVIDSMRTALFTLPGISDSIWTELSIWNRSFAHRIRTDSVVPTVNKSPYKFRYILQKRTKYSPLAIIYPSIGEGIKSHHSVVFAKMFYDLGYSVIIQGSSFQWEFAQSMPDNYTPGLPKNDAEELKKISGMIIEKLQDKYKYKFTNRVILGTSFGALTALFVADSENKNNTLNITKFISINPPIELFYAMKAVDKNGEEWALNSDGLKDKVALAAAKVLKLNNQKDEKGFNIDNLPFNEYEAKLITGFVMHQKLSDLLYVMEKIPDNQKTEFYNNINNTNFQDYLKKYIIKDNILAYDELNFDTSLYSISDYLENNNNYKIYHTLDDYLVNSHQLNILKKYTKDKSVFISNGSHLGFMYREEFINALKKEIETIKNTSS